MSAVWAFVFVIRGHLPYIAQPYQVNIDEGYVLADGQRMLHGSMLPYVDAVAHCGPLFLWSGALLAALDEFSWLPIRVAAAAAFAANVALIFACARRAGYSFAGAVAAMAIPLWCVLKTASLDGIAYNQEVLATLFALLALLGIVRAVGSEERAWSWWWMVVAGASVSLAALAKQVGALLAVPLVLYVVVAAWGRRDLTSADRRRVLVTFFVSAALPPAIMLLWIVLAGGFSDFYYYVVTYNREIYMHYTKGISRLAWYRAWLDGNPLEVTVAFATIGWGLAQLIAARRDAGSWLQAYHRRAFVLTVAQLAFLSVVGARASMREFDHYYVLAVPWFGLLAGLLVDRASPQAVPGSSSKLLCVYRVALLLPVLLAGEVAWSLRKNNLKAFSGEHWDLKDLHVAAREPPVCSFIRSHSAPGDTLFVWGFRPELYVSCNRNPASRFVFTTFVAGFVPWVMDSTKEQEDALAVPGSRDLLIRELEATKPPVVVDAASTSLGGRKITRYEELARYLNDHYRPAGRFGGDEVYVRLASK